MKYIDLIKEIPNEDKENMLNYIDEYGISKEEFIGFEAWLSNWSHAKQKLYRFLGNTLIKKYPFEREKSEGEIEAELSKLIDNDVFIEEFRIQFLTCNSIFGTKNLPLLTGDQNSALISYIRTDTFLQDKIFFSFKYKYENKPMLQLQAGMKPIRALGKIVAYFKDKIDLTESFERFRIAHSMIFNDKKVKGNLCFSIHPFDFLTMSDNASNWSSCMSWRDKGCYHAGTIEMMNSNNVVCCYIESDTKFDFGGKYSIGTWNNKKWRQLLYVTKDIIMTGKAYPYPEKSVSWDILEKAKDLANNNLNWHYSFGIERYNDMQHIDTYNKMLRNKEWIQSGNTIKHNIIWDTKSMYNDMFNDQGTSYWCLRNKVKTNKMISASGKCNCLKCNNTIVNFQWDVDYYNDRYDNADRHLCNECEELFHCDVCGKSDSHLKHTEIYLKNDNNNGYISAKDICITCFNKYVKICPCCKEPMYANSDYVTLDNKIQPSIIYNTSKPFLGSCGNFTSLLQSADFNAEFLYICDNCIKKNLDKLQYVPVTVREWNYKAGYNNVPGLALVFKDKDYAEKFKYANLESIDFTEDILSLNLCVDGVTSDLVKMTPHLWEAKKALIKMGAA